MDKSLDDIIQENKKNRSTRGRGRGRRGGSGPGPMRRGRLSRRRNNTPYSGSAMEIDDDDNNNIVWQHDKYEPEEDVNMDSGYSFKKNNRIRRLNRLTGGYQTGYKLLISNLHFDVSTEDIKDLFGKIGDLKRATVHYDKSGRSEGTAEVVFSRKQDALNALKKYNNNALDDRIMKIELLGPNVISRGTRGSRVLGQNRSIRITAGRTLRRLWQSKMGGRTLRRGGSRGGRINRGGFGGRRGRGGRGSRNKGVVPTKDFLDNDIDEYVNSN